MSLKRSEGQIVVELNLDAHSSIYTAFSENLVEAADVSSDARRCTGAITNCFIWACASLMCKEIPRSPKVEHGSHDEV